MPEESHLLAFQEPQKHNTAVSTRFDERKFEDTYEENGHELEEPRRVLPYISYIGMCCCGGSGFQAV